MPISALRTFYEFGMQGRSGDFNNDGYNVGVIASRIMASFVGDREVLPAVNPIACTPGSGLTVLVGALGQRVFVRDTNGSLQLADYLPTQTVTIAAADTSQTRIDLISMLYNEVDAGDFNVAYQDAQGNVSTPPNGVNAHYVGRSISLVYTEGTPGGGAPTVPSGTYALAEVQVLANATSLLQGNIANQVPTLAYLLQQSGAVPAFSETFNSVDGYLNFGDSEGNDVNILLNQPYPTIYSSPDNSVNISITPDTITQPVLPSHPLTLNLSVDATKIGNTQGAGGTSTIAGQAGIAYSSFRQNIGSAYTGFEPSSDVNYNGIAAPLGYVQYIQLRATPCTIQFELGIRVKAGAGAQTIGGPAEATGNFFVGLNDVIKFGPQNSTIQMNWSVTVPDDGNVHTLVFHVDNTTSSSILVAAWIPQNGNGGIDTTKFDYIGPITHYP